VLDTGARGATTTFVQRGIGDVLIAWENEALLASEEVGRDTVDIVVPSVSILAEPSVALVDKNVDAHGTRKVAEAYLQYLYSPEAQQLAARNHYRPRLKEVADANRAQFPAVPLFTVDEVFGGWQAAQAKHFSDGGVFDQIYRPSN
jgi:sulfate/thiosulfate-binding protein